MQQILRPIGEYEILLVEGLSLFLSRILIGYRTFFDTLLLGLCVVGRNQPLLIFFLQLGSFGLQVLFALRPAFLRFLRLLLEGGAFILIEVALRQYGFDLYIATSPAPCWAVAVVSDASVAVSADFVPQAIMHRAAASVKIVFS